MTLTPNFGDFGIIFEGWSYILPPTKLFCHGIEQSCSAMATQKLEEDEDAEDVEQHDEDDEDAESSKAGCRSPSRTHAKASACTDLRQLCPPHLVRSFHFWGLFCS